MGHGPTECGGFPVRHRSDVGWEDGAYDFLFLTTKDTKNTKGKDESVGDFVLFVVNHIPRLVHRAVNDSYSKELERLVKTVARISLPCSYRGLAGLLRWGLSWRCGGHGRLEDEQAELVGGIGGSGFAASCCAGPGLVAG